MSSSMVSKQISYLHVSLTAAPVNIKQVILLQQRAVVACKSEYSP